MLDIGLEIKILRERLKIPSKELAQKIGLSQSQMSRLEKGQRRIDIHTLRKIAEALGVEPSFFFRSRGEEPTGEEVKLVPGAGTPTPAFAPALPYDHLGKLVRSERRRKHLTVDEFAAKVGRTKAYMAALEEGRHPLDEDLAARICRALRLSPNFFLKAQGERIRVLEGQQARLYQALAEAHRGRAGSPDGEVSLARGIPYFGSLAGHDSLTFDWEGNPCGEPQDFVVLPGVEGKGCFVMAVSGDGMETAGSLSFREGDLLVFSAAGIPRSRDFVLARLEEGPPLFRQIFFDPDGTVRLQPLNLNHPAQTCHRKDILGLWKLALHIARV